MLPLLALTLLLSSGAAAAGQGADPPDSLAALVKSQLRRIDALEARLAALQQEVAQLRQQPMAPAAGPAEPPAVVHAQAKSELVDHAVAGEAPGEAIAGRPAGRPATRQDLDSYGSLRAAAAIDSDGNREIRNNSSRLGLRGTKRLTDGIQAFGRIEVGVNMVATDRVILSGGDPGAPIGQGSQAVFSRLGYVGLDTGIGSFAWGKQWSPTMTSRFLPTSSRSGAAPQRAPSGPAPTGASRDRAGGAGAPIPRGEGPGERGPADAKPRQLGQ